MPEQKQTPDSIEQFPPRMSPGETVLWEGQPRAAVFVRNKMRASLTWALIAIAFALWDNWLRLGHSIASISWYLLSAIIFPFAFAVWVDFHVRMECANQTRYAVTNNRIIIRTLQSFPDNKKRYPIIDLRLACIQPRLIMRPSGLGTITLGFRNTDYALQEIEEAAHVYRIIEQARGVLSAASNETILSLKSHPYTINELLRAEESILWQGKPEKPDFLWRQMLISLCTTTPIAAIFYWLVASSRFPGSLSTIIMMSGGAFVLISLFQLWLLIREWSRLDYYVTNQRIIIAKQVNNGVEIDDRELWEVNEPTTRASNSGTGTIIFEQGTKFLWVGWGNALISDDYRFHSIPDAELVMRRIESERDPGKNNES